MIVHFLACHNTKVGKWHSSRGAQESATKLSFVSHLFDRFVSPSFLLYLYSDYCVHPSSSCKSCDGQSYCIMAPHQITDDIAGKTYSMTINDVNTRTKPSKSLPHPLNALSISECDKVRDGVLRARGTDTVVKFRTIFLSEPIKKELIPYLEAERTGSVSEDIQRPARLGLAHYDIIQADRSVQYHESTIDISTGKEVKHRPIGEPHFSALTTWVNALGQHLPQLNIISVASFGVSTML